MGSCDGYGNFPMVRFMKNSVLSTDFFHNISDEKTKWKALYSQILSFINIQPLMER